MARHVRMDLARKMLRQGPAEGFRRYRLFGGIGRLHLFDGACSLQIFDLELQLLDLAKHLLALPAEEHMLQLLDRQREPFDLCSTRAERPRIALMLRDYESLHRFKIKRIQVREGGLQ